MSTPGEQLKTAIVIFEDIIAIVDPEINGATEVACQNLHKLVGYVQTLDPKLKRHEAIVMTAAILDGLPSLLETDPDLIAGIKTECQALRGQRNE